jgi:hypothetical protein
MTGEERKKCGEKSAVIVERLVRLQLRAMGCERFYIGNQRDAGEMLLRERQDGVGRWRAARFCYWDRFGRAATPARAIVLYISVAPWDHRIPAPRGHERDDRYVPAHVAC